MVVVRSVQGVDFFNPERFTVKQCLHCSSSAAHFALVGAFIIVEIEPLVKIVLKLLKVLVYFLSKSYSVKLVQDGLVKALTDSVSLRVADFGFGVLDIIDSQI